MIQFILYVSDQETSKKFYSAILGMQPLLDVPGMTEYQLAENCKLGLMPERGIASIIDTALPHPSSGNGIPRCELYLFVDDVEYSYSLSIAAGAKEISPVSIRDWGDSVGYVADTDGHIVAFAKKNM